MFYDWLTAQFELSIFDFLSPAVASFLLGDTKKGAQTWVFKFLVQKVLRK